MGKGFGRRFGLIVGTCTLLAGLAPATASADTDIAEVGTLLFISSDGLNNSMEFKVVSLKYRTVDSGSTLVPGTNCARNPPADAHVVDCQPLVFEAIVGLGDGKDDFTPAPYIELPITMIGEGGQDQLTGGAGADSLTGNAGNDYSDGAGGDDQLTDGYAGTLGGGVGSGNDFMYGSAGNDYLDAGTFATTPDAGSGSDTLGGGAGTDTADYSKRTLPLRLTEGDGANDGQDVGGGPGSEGDDLADAEVILGGAAGDVIGGAAGPNTLRGGGGNDDLLGGGGDDSLLGDDGGDTLDGGPGGDSLEGGHGIDAISYAGRTQPVTVVLDGLPNDGEAGEGDDVDDDIENVEGGAAGDAITGGPGPNALRGNDGDDAIDARDGSTDTVDCGSGKDAVEADAFDVVAADCESVGRSSVPNPGGGLVALKLPRSIKVKDGEARVSVGCPRSATGGCAKGKLAALAGKRTLASARFSLAAGDRARVPLRFDRRALAMLKRRKSVLLSATAKGAAAARAKAKLRANP